MAKESAVAVKEERSVPWKGRKVKRKFTATRTGEEMIRRLFLAHRVTT